MRSRYPGTHREPSAAVTVADERLARIHERPDGFHWTDETGRQEFGPFATVEEALADMEAPSSAPDTAMGAIEAREQGLDVEDASRRSDDEEFGDRELPEAP